MDNDNGLILEINKLDLPELKKIASTWNILKFNAKDKKQGVAQIYESFQDEFLLKGVLEKLTPIQVTILSHILKNKNVQTLGEIVRKVLLPPLNVEMELNVLRKFHLLYQRKNRERLTNNLDKYHTYDEISNLVKEVKTIEPISDTGSEVADFLIAAAANIPESSEEVVEPTASVVGTVKKAKFPGASKSNLMDSEK